MLGIIHISFSYLKLSSESAGCVNHLLMGFRIHTPWDSYSMDGSVSAPIILMQFGDLSLCAHGTIDQ